MTDGREQFEVLKEAENLDRVTSGYFAAFAWPGDLCNPPNSANSIWET